MSAGHDHDHGHGTVGFHATLRDYLIGFFLSAGLTAVPFWLVMTRPYGAATTAAVILVFAAVQMVVHVIYFLHVNGKAEGGWTMTALVFTIIVVAITLSGSLWVMYHLNHNMMPVSASQMSQMP